MDGPGEVIYRTFENAVNSTMIRSKKFHVPFISKPENEIGTCLLIKMDYFS